MIEFSLQDDVLLLDGDFGRDDIVALEAELPPLLTRCTVCDCDNLDIDGGMAMAALVRLLLHRALDRTLVVRGAPQMLAHNLYRTHGLERGVTLENVRFDEASVQ
ncbi:MAG TPA: hypothetical protein VF681_02880 [Abditibacteriaceae bacterium]|jgi:hypothetical protein